MKTKNILALGMAVAGLVGMVNGCKSSPEPLKIEGEASFYADHITMCEYVRENGPCGSYINSNVDKTFGCFNVPSLTSPNRYCIVVSGIPENYETAPEVLEINPLYGEYPELDAKPKELQNKLGQTIFLDACRRTQCIEHYQNWQRFIEQRNQ